jgi:hypothetical protein
MGTPLTRPWRCCWQVARCGGGGRQPGLHAQRRSGAPIPAGRLPAAVRGARGQQRQGPVRQQRGGQAGGGGRHLGRRGAVPALRPARGRGGARVARQLPGQLAAGPGRHAAARAGGVHQRHRQGALDQVRGTRRTRPAAAAGAWPPGPRRTRRPVPLPITPPPPTPHAPPPPPRPRCRMVVLLLWAVRHSALYGSYARAVLPPPSCPQSLLRLDLQHCAALLEPEVAALVRDLQQQVQRELLGLQPLLPSLGLGDCSSQHLWWAFDLGEPPLPAPSPWGAASRALAAPACTAAPVISCRPFHGHSSARCAERRSAAPQCAPAASAASCPAAPSWRYTRRCWTWPTTPTSPTAASCWTPPPAPWAWLPPGTRGCPRARRCSSATARP